MRRKNSIDIEIISPTKGVITRVPSNQAEQKSGRAVTVGENMRFSDGVARNAPGYEKIFICPSTALDDVGAPVSLFASNIVSDLQSIANDAPILGTSQRIFRLDRRFGSTCEGVTASETEAPYIVVPPYAPCSPTGTCGPHVIATATLANGVIWDLTAYQRVTRNRGGGVFIDVDCAGIGWVLLEDYTTDVVIAAGNIGYSAHVSDCSMVDLIGLPNRLRNGWVHGASYALIIRTGDTNVNNTSIDQINYH